MLNPGTLLDAIVTMYRSVPALVSALGSADRIYPFVDKYPSDGLALYIFAKVNPGDLMIVWNGSRIVRGSGRTIRSHHFSAIWRPRSSVIVTSTDAYAVLPLLQDGIPSGKSVSPLYFGVLDSCDPMSIHEPTRKSIVIDERGAALDYIDSAFTISEIGDPQ